MARSKNNVITHGLSGKVGDLIVFRQRHGKTFVTKLPAGNGATTAPQKEVQQKFQQAVVYAKAALADPELRKAYEQKAGIGQSAYNKAIADFFTAPEVPEVNTSAYTGAAGSVIRILATDDFVVKSVAVSITDAAGSEVEKGDAVIETNGLYWHYTATAQLAVITGAVVKITAIDRAGNLAVLDKTLE